MARWRRHVGSSVVVGGDLERQFGGDAPEGVDPPRQDVGVHAFRDAQAKLLVELRESRLFGKTLTG